MGIASDLRQSVLQAAMQGKLTTQKAEDGDARELLLAIREEKEKLVKEKRIKKEKPLAPIADGEIPFDIPENWVWCRLGEIYCVLNGDRGKNYPAKSSLKHEGNIPFISALNLNGYNVAVDDKLLFATQEQYNKLNAGKLKYNDTVLCIRGSIGKHGRFQFNVGAISSSLVIIRPYVTQDLAEYLGFYLDSNIFTLEVTKYNNGTAQPNLAAADLKKFIIPLPPLPEQQRIVARVEALMKEIDELEQTEKELEAIKAAFPADMKASLLQAAMEGKLTTQKAEDGDARGLLLAIREEKEKLVKEKKGKKEKPLAPITDEEIPFDIPENWVWCRLGEIFSHIAGKALNKKDENGSKHKYITTSNVYWDHFELNNLREMYYTDTEKEKYSLKPGDLLILEGGDIGRTAIWDKNESYCIQNHIHRLRPYLPIYIRYFYYMMMFYKLSDMIAGKGIAIKGLSANVVHNICVPLPPLAEQQRIVEKLGQLLPLCDSLSEH